jgi:hypothetical protein
MERRDAEGAHPSQQPLSSYRTFPDDLSNTFPVTLFDEPRIPKNVLALKFTTASSPVSLHFTVVAPTHEVPAFGKNRICKLGEVNSYVS